MPTVRIKGYEAFKIVIHTRNEHPWPHVHVKKTIGEDECVIKLGDRKTLPHFDEDTWSSMSRRDLKISLYLVVKYRKQLRKKWYESRPEKSKPHDKAADKRRGV